MFEFPGQEWKVRFALADDTKLVADGAGELEAIARPVTALASDVSVSNWSHEPW